MPAAESLPPGRTAGDLHGPRTSSGSSHCSGGAHPHSSRTTGLPLVPDGLGDPGQAPLFPQRYGEIMAGRIATSASVAEIPVSLARMRVGPATAREIGWLQ